MKWLESCLIAISMYSKIPVPQVEWTKEKMSHAMCFFPLVGAIEGCFLGLWLFIAAQFHLSVGMRFLWASAIPFLVTGGIHMDGFMDTMDAVHSYGDRTKKLEILKDPHLGAFAVICAVVYLLLYTGSMYEFCENASGKAYFYPVLFLFSERVFSGLSVVMFPSAKNNGLAATFSQASEKALDKKIQDATTEKSKAEKKKSEIVNSAEYHKAADVLKLEKDTLGTENDAAGAKTAWGAYKKASADSLDQCDNFVLKIK